MMLSERLEQKAQDKKLDILRINLAGTISAVLVGDLVCMSSQADGYSYNSLLSHEIHHFDTCEFNLTNAPKTTQQKYEAIANRLTFEELLPVDKLIEYRLHGHDDPEEFIEHFEVNFDFFYRALAYYHDRYGYDYKYKGNRVSFMPFIVKAKE